MMDKSVMNIYVSSLFDKFNKTSSFKDSSSFKKIERFFSLNDWINTTNYYKNLESLKCDFDVFSIGSNNDAEYLYEENKIRYSNASSLVHELFHVASSKDRTYCGSVSLFGGKTALNEGFAEYFTSLVDGGDSSYYPIEKTAVAMLVYTYGVEMFKEFFNANYQGFLNQFSTDTELSKVLRVIDSLEEHYQTYSSSSFSKMVRLRLEIYQKDIFKQLCDIIVYHEGIKGNNDISMIKDDIIKISSDMQLARFIDFDFTKYIDNVFSGIGEERKYMGGVKR